MGEPNRLDLDLAALRRWGAEHQVHSMRNLLEHLVGTHDVLRRWGCRPALCRAGLFHSIYGTESFWGSLRTFDQRDDVRRVCGPECEEIVYLFSAMTRESFDESLVAGPGEGLRRVRDRLCGDWIELRAGRHSDLCHLSAGNWVEQVPRLSEPYLEMGRERSRRLLEHLVPKARRELEEVYGGTLAPVG